MASNRIGLRLVVAFVPGSRPMYTITSLRPAPGTIHCTLPVAEMVLAYTTPSKKVLP